jgi:enoyl-CoA hydratase/carnithine racemase
MTEYVTCVDHGPVRLLTLNRPDKKNALTHAMYAALADGLEGADADPALKVIVLTGAGDAFTAGNDLADFAAPQPAVRPVERFLHDVASTRKPIIAAVNGLAVGVGLTMLLHCDVVYAAPEATFSVPFTNLGLVPEAASSLLLTRLVGHQRAAEIFLFGEPIDAAEAHRIGLVNRIIGRSALVETALARAQILAAKAPTAVRLTKQLMKSATADVAGRMAEEGAHFQAQLKSAEVKEAIAAFMEKRKPNFSRFG